MIKAKILLGTMFILFLMIPCSLCSGDKVIKKGDTLPVVQLPAPEKPAHRKYLGLQKEGTFTTQDIKAEVIIIQIYQESCIHCRKEAPTVNKLYKILSTNKKTKGKVKLIGIGAKNDIYYVRLFQKEYNVPFPLLPDKDLSICETLGYPGKTPFFICAKLMDDSKFKVFYVRKGPIERADEFLKLIVEKSEL